MDVYNIEFLIDNHEELMYNVRNVWFYWIRHWDLFDFVHEYPVVFFIRV